MFLGEKFNNQYLPTTNPVTNNSNLPARNTDAIMAQNNQTTFLWYLRPTQ